MDRTAWFWAAASSCAQAQGLPQEKLTKLRNQAKDVVALSDFIKRHQQDYTRPGRCSEAERDKIEEQVGTYLRRCTDHIAKLRTAVDTGDVQQGSAAVVNVTAHRLGMALVLSERLKAISTAFDQCRSLRYQQRVKQEQHVNQRRIALYAQSGLSGSAALDCPTSHQLQPQPLPFPSTGPESSLDLQQQQVLEAESSALVAELSGTAGDVARLEGSMRELAMLNQMFSSQVMHQAEQIEQLYSQAVRATVNINAGNVHLRKAIRHNASARLYVLVLLMVASFGLLFLDWWTTRRA